MADFVCWYPQRQSFESGSLLLDFLDAKSAAEAYVESCFRRIGAKPTCEEAPHEIYVAQVRVLIENGRGRPVPDDTKTQWLVKIVPSVAFRAKAAP